MDNNWRIGSHSPYVLQRISHVHVKYIQINNFSQSVMSNYNTEEGNSRLMNMKSNWFNRWSEMCPRLQDWGLVS